MDPSVIAQLREEYSPDGILDVVYKANKQTSPLFAMCETRAVRESFGKKFVVPVLVDEGAAVAADPVVADNISGDGVVGGNPAAYAWEVSPVSIDSTFSLTRQEMLHAGTLSKDRQFDYVAQRMDAALERLRNILAKQVIQDGTGVEAQISAITSSTITIPAILRHRFKIGDRLVASVSPFTDVLLGTPPGASLAITGISSTGVLTLSGNPQTVWANNPSLYIFRAGMRVATDPNDAESAKIALTGLKAVINPSATSALWGVARAGNPELTGVGVVCTGDTVDCLTDIAEVAFHRGRPIDTILVSGTTWKLLTQDKDSSKLVNVSLGEYSIGFKAFELPTSFGSTMIIPESGLEPGEAYAGPFQDKELGPKIYYQGRGLINLDDLDSLEFRRGSAAGSRSYKGNFFFSGQFIIPAPGRYIKATGLPTS